MVSKIEQEHIGRLLYIHEQHNPVWEAIARLWEYCSQHRLGGCENFKAFVMAEVERYGVLNGPQSLIKQQTGITLIAKGFKDAKLQ